MALNWGTARTALRPLGALEAGEVVLIHAAAGGAGQAAVRLVRHYGARIGATASPGTTARRHRLARHCGGRIVATASPERHDTVGALGADVVLDSRRAGRADLVLESVGRATWDVSRSVTKAFDGLEAGRTVGNHTLDPSR
jgi:NADPH2:quinone reductase